MAAGDKVTIEYAYVFGDTVETVDIATEVSEPSMLLIFGLGLAGLAYARRRKSV